MVGREGDRAGSGHTADPCSGVGVGGGGECSPFGLRPFYCSAPYHLGVSCSGCSLLIHRAVAGTCRGGGGVGAWGKRGSKGICVFFPPKFSTRMMSASCSGGQSKRLRTVNTVMLMMTVPVLMFLWCPDGNARIPGRVYFTSGSSEKDVQMSITDRLEQVRLTSLPSPRLNEANLAAASDPFGALSISDIRPTILPSPHPSAPPSESTTSSFLPQP